MLDTFLLCLVFVVYYYFVLPTQRHVAPTTRLRLQVCLRNRHGTVWVTACENERIFIAAADRFRRNSCALSLPPYTKAVDPAYHDERSLNSAFFSTKHQRVHRDYDAHRALHTLFWSTPTC